MKENNNELPLDDAVEATQPQRKEISPEKIKALQVAMDKIDKTYGRGSIMKLGDDHIENVEVIPTGSIGLDFALGVGGYPAGASSRSTAPSRAARPHWPFMPSPRPKSKAALQPSSTPSTPSTASMPRAWAWMSTVCSSRNPTTASRPWR